jgi:hypothetical protein
MQTIVFFGCLEYLHDDLCLVRAFKVQELGAWKVILISWLIALPIHGATAENGARGYHADCLLRLLSFLSQRRSEMELSGRIRADSCRSLLCIQGMVGG